jgi:hypothetical protein
LLGSKGLFSTSVGRAGRWTFPSRAPQNLFSSGAVQYGVRRPEPIPTTHGMLRGRRTERIPTSRVAGQFVSRRKHFRPSRLFFDTGLLISPSQLFFHFSHPPLDLSLLPLPIFPATRMRGTKLRRSAWQQPIDRPRQSPRRG